MADFNITQDHTFTEDERKDGYKPATEKACYHEGDQSLCTIPVKLYDDDNVLYLEGFISERTLNGDESEVFRLQDIAMSDLGVTRMDFQLSENGEWQTL